MTGFGQMSFITLQHLPLMRSIDPFLLHLGKIKRKQEMISLQMRGKKHHQNHALRLGRGF